MRFAAQRRLDDDVLERAFTLDEVPGLLWTSEAEAALEAGATAVSAPMGGEP